MLVRGIFVHSVAAESPPLFQCVACLCHWKVVGGGELQLCKCQGGAGGPCGYFGQCHKCTQRYTHLSLSLYCPPREQNSNLIFHEISHCNHVGLIEEVKLLLLSPYIRARLRY